jgi:tetratricopeptide (TPR) repeat protein
MLGQVSFCLSDFRACGDALVRAAELSDDAESTALMLGMASYAYHWGHDYGRDRETSKRAMAFSRQHGIRVGEGLAALCEGFFGATAGSDFEGSAALITKGVQLIGSHPRAEGLAMLIEGEQAEWTGDFERALELQTQAIARAKSDPVLTIEASWFAGKASCCLGRYADALARLDQAVQLAERIGDRALTARLRNTMGWLYAEIGCHQIAAEYNRRASATAHEMVSLGLVPGAPELYGNAAINLAGNLIELGELDTAGEHLARVREMISASSDHWMEWRYSMHLLDTEARLALRRGDPDLALHQCDEELAAARRTRARKVEARALELRARALLLAERRDEARAEVANAESVGRSIHYPPVIWRSHALAAALCVAEGDRAGAAQQAAAATAMIEEHAAPLTETLRRQFRAMGEQLVTRPPA